MYAEAYAAVEQGICFDEVGDTEGSKMMYLRGLELVDRAVQIPGADKTDKYQKLMKGRQFVTQRLTEMNVTPPAYSVNNLRKLN